MFGFLTKRRRQPAGDVLMQITVRQAPDNTSDLQALGIDVQPMATSIHSDLCEHAQLQILAHLLADVSQSDHLADTPDLQALARFPRQVLDEAALQIAAQEGTGQ